MRSNEGTCLPSGVLTRTKQDEALEAAKDDIRRGKRLVLVSRGLPASGKSTWAWQLQQQVGIDRLKIVTKDKIRAMVNNGQWDKKSEKFTIAVRDSIIRQALRDGFSIVVDDTNFGKHEEDIRALVSSNSQKFDYEVVVVDFTDIPLEECIKRDKARERTVGEDVIRRMYNQYIRKPIDPAPIDLKLPWCTLVDIDGTVAKMHDRGPFEWHKVGQDKPRHHVLDAAIGTTIHGQSELIFLSGRDGICRPQTEAWIDLHTGIKSPRLFMRPQGDCRPDTEVKEEIYRREILGKYNVTAVFDDRAQVCRMWKELGLGDKTFRVGLIEEDDF